MLGGHVAGCSPQACSFACSFLIGSRPTDHSPQHNGWGGSTWLLPHLAGFARVALAAGEEKQIAVKLDKHAFTVVNDAGERIADGKVYDLYCGLSQPDARSVELMGQAPLKAKVVFE